MKNTKKIYAVLIDGRVRGTVTAIVSSGYIQAAGCITRDGYPVNRVGARLSLNSRHIDLAIFQDLPVYTLRCHGSLDFIVPTSELARDEED